jgi:HTH-type transcriptional regulator/antitoxin HigA
MNNNTTIQTEQQYEATMSRIDELLKVVGENTPTTDKDFIELDLLSNLAADYEHQHYPVTPPTLVEVLKLRMYEMGLTQTKLSELLNISKSRVSDYLTGRSEPTLKVARIMRSSLNIDADIILGV